MKQKLSSNEIIAKANNKHQNKYTYNLEIITKSKDKIKIICEEHGLFIQRLDHHLNGSGCPKCMGRAKVNSELISKYQLIHGDKYDYSLVEYKTANARIKIICKKHGVFEVTSRQHLSGVNCSKCVRERISNSQRKTTSNFITKATITHGKEYDYSLVNYVKATEPVKIICGKHGLFYQIPRAHINGTGCPICRESKGEREVRRFLEKNNIDFKPQYKFPNCKNIRPLPFDFYLPSHNICVEFHGEQHYLNKQFFGGEKQLAYIKNNDAIKRKYCSDNNIELFILSYKDYNVIDSLLHDHLKLL